MKWEKYTIQTTTQAEDFVSGILAGLGIEGVQIEDNVPLSQEDKEKMFIDILPELPPDEGVAFVSFYLDAGKAHNSLLGQVKEELENLRLSMDIGAGTIAQGETEDKDWINNWKQYFKPFMVEGILIKPTWESLPIPWITAAWLKLTQEPPLAQASMKRRGSASSRFANTWNQGTRC